MNQPGTVDCRLKWTLSMIDWIAGVPKYVHAVSAGDSHSFRSFMYPCLQNAVSHALMSIGVTEGKE
uniref:Uncharacterized protein n=1 Tax=Pristionchus pacificus TaxID=54126 RepID=A0A2A6CC58_PRIPA|eukprot:PDM75611.1 hypothetical protein PRIPAC_42788 [Pristionchus pacificus]